MKKITISLITLFVIIFGFNYGLKKFNFNTNHQIGEKIDSLNGIYVFYNGGVGNSSGRNISEDGYNLGLQYQCVEFVKRYYYENYNHKMPDAFGNAKDFFNKNLKDGEKNLQRDLIQFTNPSKSKPEIGDLLIYSPSIFNKFGHVAIVSKVNQNSIEIIQQNPGPFSKSRESFNIENINNKWKIKNSRILGWLRKE